jgi:murein DD-endopeptidase MepM/ murein hydrolase activator NlpD
MRRAAAVAVFVALVVAAVGPSAGADLEGDLSRVENRLAEYRGLVQQAATQRSDLAVRLLATGARLEDLTTDLAAAGREVEAAEREIDATESAISLLQATIDDRIEYVGVLQDRVEQVKDDALARAVELYMAPWRAEGPIPDAELDARTLVALAYAERVQQVTDRDIATLESLRAEERRTLAQLEDERAALGNRIADLEDARVERELAAEMVAERRSAVEEELAVQEALLADIDREIDEIEGEIAGLAAEESRIRQLIEEEQRLGGDRPGILARPVPGAVGSWFGYRVHPIYGEQRLHTGLDMNAYCGEPIRAAGDGRVFLADWKGGYGITVMIDHGGGMSTLYAHQASTAVGYGQWVTAGEVIGYGGTTGVSTSCHLHFEVRINGDPVDPAPYL